MEVPVDSHSLLSCGFELKFLVACNFNNPIDSSTNAPTPPAENTDIINLVNNNETQSTPQPILLTPTRSNNQTCHTPPTPPEATQQPTRRSFFNRRVPRQENTTTVTGSSPDTTGANNLVLPVQTLRPMETTTTDGQLQEQAYRILAETISGVEGQMAVALGDLEERGLTDSEYWRTGWIVKKANSAEIVKGEVEHVERRFPGSFWVPVEVTSPIFKVEEYRQTTEHVQGVLRAIRQKHIAVANHTCDVHVHLGRMDSRAFSLENLKRLAVLLWLTEDALRSVRDPTSKNFDNVYTWGAPVTIHSRLARKLPLPLSTAPSIPEDPAWFSPSTHPPDKTQLLKMSGICGTPQMTSALRSILSVKSHRELGLLLSGPEKQYRRLGMNFSAFGLEDERSGKNPRTVELRVLEGTVDGMIVAEWIELLGKLIEKAVEEDDEGGSLEFAIEMMRLHTKEPSEQLRDIKMALGVL